MKLVLLIVLLNGFVKLGMCDYRSQLPVIISVTTSGMEQAVLPLLQLSNMFDAEFLKGTTPIGYRVKIFRKIFWSMIQSMPIYDDGGPHSLNVGFRSPTSSSQYDPIFTDGFLLIYYNNGSYYPDDYSMSFGGVQDNSIDLDGLFDLHSGDAIFTDRGGCNTTFGDVSHRCRSYWSVDSNGLPVEQTYQKGPYVAYNESGWYTSTPGPSWGPLRLTDKGYLEISAMIPLFNSSKQIGAVSADMRLAQLNETLHALSSSLGIETFIMEGHPPYNLIGASIGEFVKLTSGDLNRISATESTSNVVRKTSQAIVEGTVPFGSTTIVDEYYIDARRLSNIGSFPLTLPWIYVTAQPVLCEEGEIVSNESLTCEPCTLDERYGEGYSSPGGGATTCDLCVEGYFLDATESCQRCPANAICKGGRAVPFALPGFWMDTNDVAFLGDDAMCCSRSYGFGGVCQTHTSDCLGGEEFFDMCFKSKVHLANCSISNLLCKDGSSRMLCDTCEADFFKSGTSCTGCQGSLTGTIVLFFVVLAVCIVVAGLVIRYRDFIEENFPLLIAAVFNPGRFKIVFAALQILGSVSRATGIAWPEPFATLAGLYEVAELNMFDTLPVSCFLGVNFYTNLMVSTLWPLCLLCIILILCNVGPDGLIHEHSTNCHCKPLCDKFVNRVKNKAFMRRSTGEKIIIFVAYCVFPSVSLTLGKVFACTSFPDGSSWLSTDLTIPCTATDGSVDPTWFNMRLFSCFMIAVYVFPGIPSSIFLLLQSNKKHIEEYYNQDQKQTINKKIRPVLFLFDRYRFEYINFEVFESFRRIWFCMGIVLMENFYSSAKRSFIGMLSALVYFIGFQYAKPFRLGEHLNALATGANMTILFTYTMAFVLACAPFGTTDNTVLGTILVVLNLSFLGVAIWFQRVEYEEQRKLIALKKEIDAFREEMVGVFFVRQSLNYRDRRRFFENYSFDPTNLTREEKVRVSLARGINPEGLNSTELTKNIEIMEAGLYRNKWFWEVKKWERATLQQNQDHVLEKNGIKFLPYHDNISALIEHAYQEWITGNALEEKEEHNCGLWLGDATADLDGVQMTTGSAKEKHIVALDLTDERRVVGDVVKGDHGLNYRVDVREKIQWNVNSKVKRAVLRIGAEDDKGKANLAQKKLGPVSKPMSEATSMTSGTQISLAVDDERIRYSWRDVDLEDDPWAKDSDHRPDVKVVNIPRFPQDLLLFQDPDEFQDAVEELDQEGQGNHTNRPQLEGASYLEAMAIGGKHEILLVQKGQLVQVSEKRSDGWWYGTVVFDPKSKLTGARSDDESRKSVQDADLGGRTSGWFPEIFVRNPQMVEMKAMQDTLKLKGTDVLAAPKTWTRDGVSDPLKYRTVDLEADSPEYKACVDAFQQTLKNPGGRAPNDKQFKTPPCPNLRIHSVKRIENLSLWQSHMARWQSIKLRAEKENKDQSTITGYWKRNLFHGCQASTIPLIAQQGFNRSFSGRNMCKYGKGVYFARDACYSASPAYSGPDEKTGHQGIFLCSVLVGEFCKGKVDALTAGVRPEYKKDNILFDSNVNDMDDPYIFVTYHDGQAYPEYLVEFEVGDGSVYAKRKP